jgi:hypothetical protein
MRIMLPLIKALGLSTPSLFRVSLVLSALLYSCSSEELSVPPAVEASGGPVEVRAEAPPVIQSAPVARGVIKFKKLTHDFGAVDDTEEVHCNFDFTNDGDGVLLIREIKPSCGCTTTTLEKMEYQPGESGSIELNFHPKGYGPQTKTITIKSNSSGNDRLVLYIKAVVTPFVQFEPRSVRFAQVPTTEGREQTVKVSCRDTGAVFGGPVCTHPSFTAEWTVPPVDGVGTLTVKLKPGAAKGNVINKVKLDVLGAKAPGEPAQKQTAELSASAAVFGEIIIEPVFLSVGRVDPGGRVDKSVILRRPEGAPFKLLSAELMNPAPANLEVSMTQTGSKWTVRVHGESGTYQGLVRGSVVIQTDVAGDPRLTIPVMGAVRPDPKK